MREMISYKSITCAVFRCFCLMFKSNMLLLLYTKICTTFKMKSIIQCYRLSRMEGKMKHKKEERIIGDEKGKKHKKEKPEFKKAVPKYKIIDKQIAELELSYENINAEKVKLFTDLPLTEETLKGLQNSKYEKPTKIQKESIG